MSDPEAGGGDDRGDSPLGDGETDPGGGEQPAGTPDGGGPTDGGGPADELPTATPDPPGESPPDPTADPSPETPAEWVRWFLETDHGAVVYLREILSSVGAVLLVGLLLFAISGLWPPMVAVESGSMEPHMERGDLVFVMEEGRLVPDAAYRDTGVVTSRTGQRTGYDKFGATGDVIVYQPGGSARTTPIIHRTHFWVNESENWVANGKADPDALGGAATCGEISQCPAPHAGFVTKGDANSRYDQAGRGSPRISPIVRPTWVIGTAEFRIPWLGNIRLLAGQTATEHPTIDERGRDVTRAAVNASDARRAVHGPVPG